ncbi:MAG: membrane dipeptidase [Ruminococcus sp.]|nr:membrane dipeptidase [Candidatus Apopatosoma intestinale]
MKVFDWHCDTAYELYKRGGSLFQNPLHVSLDRTAGYEAYVQVMAIWSEHSLSDGEAWTQFHAVRDALVRQLQKADSAVLCTDGSTVRAALESGKRALLLSVEGANLLDAKIWRLRDLWETGVRLITLVWKGADGIGGAYDTDAPLTSFGRRVVIEAMRMGMIVDVSHASRPVIDECLTLSEKTGKPIVASHSNAFAVCGHSRNLTDEHAVAIARTGGRIGISLYPGHLSADGRATVSDVARHVRHFAELGLGKAICLGCDFDGVPTLPDGISGIESMPFLWDSLHSEGFSEEFLSDLFFNNAERFVLENM